VNLFADLGFTRPKGTGANPQSKSDIFKDRHMTKQGIVLKHKTHLSVTDMSVGSIFAMKQNLPGVRRLQSSDNAQQCGLAATGGAQQRDQFPAADFKIDIT
jgi:hypothetical protein